MIRKNVTKLHFCHYIIYKNVTKLYFKVFNIYNFKLESIYLNLWELESQDSIADRVFSYGLDMGRLWSDCQ